MPAHDPLGEHIQDERDVNEPRPRSDIREIGDPDAVGSRSGEVAIQQVTGSLPVRTGDRGADLFRPCHAFQAQGAHRAVHAATGGAAPGPRRRITASHFRRPYRPSGVICTCPVTGLNFHASSRILSSTRASVTVREEMRAPLPGTVGACSDLQALLAQNAEDRLDCIPFGAHLVDEREDQRLRGSSSPAKKIEARRQGSRCPPAAA